MPSDSPPVTKPKIPLKNRAETVEMIDKAILGVADLGRIIGLAERRVHQLVLDGTLPQVAKARFEFGPTIRAYIAHLKGRDGADDSSPDSVKGHKVRLLAAQADQAELDLAKAKGDVAPVAEFERAQARMAAEVRANVMNVPARVALSLLGETDETRFKSVLRSELAAALSRTEDCALLEADADPDLGQIDADA